MIESMINIEICQDDRSVYYFKNHLQIIPTKAIEGIGSYTFLHIDFFGVKLEL